MKGERATGSNHNTSLITVRSSLRHLTSSLVSPLTPALSFRSHFRTVASLAHHRLLKLNSIFSITYGPSSSTLISLYKSYIRSLFEAACVASPAIQRRIQTHFISRALSIPPFIHNDRIRQHAYFPPIHDRNLYLAKCWYRRAMLHSRGVQDYIDNRTNDNRNIRCSRNTPLELIRN